MKIQPSCSNLNQFVVETLLRKKTGSGSCFRTTKFEFSQNSSYVYDLNSFKARVRASIIRPDSIMDS